MSVDGREFRKTLGCFATGITVVAGLNGQGLPVGVTVNAFTSVSLDPPLVAFCLGRDTTHHGDLVAGARFVVNILAADQEAVSQHFASRQYQTDWSAIDHRATEGGVPAINGVVATIECVRHAVADGGDHSIIIGLVERVAWREDTQPLLYLRGRYAVPA